MADLGDLPRCPWCKSADIIKTLGGYECMAKDCGEKFEHPVILNDRAKLEIVDKRKTKNKTLALQRSKKHMEDNGWIAHIVEKWIPPRGAMKFGVRVDVWGFGDLLCCRPPVVAVRPPGELVSPGRTALVQCFPEARFKDHREKILQIKEARIWLEAGNKIFLQGWALRPKGGVRGAVKRWQLHEEEITL